MMVYDITDLESFQNLNSWLIEIEKNASKNVYKILIGNKSDLESERKVTYEQGAEFAAQYGMKFIETSAKESKNVQEAFVTMTKEIIAQNNEKKVVKKEDDNTARMRIDAKNTGKNIQTGGCCA